MSDPGATINPQAPSAEDSVTKPVMTGSWTDPKTGLLYEEEFDVEKIHEWREWAPNYIAAIEAGVYDEWMYEIAAACHRRHLATNGMATNLRPSPPDNEELTANDIPMAMMLETGSIVPTDVTRAGIRLLEFCGKRYAWATVRGRYFQGPPHFASSLRGVWFRIEDYDLDSQTFQARIVSRPKHSFSLGNTLTIDFDSLSHLFQ